MVNVVIYLKDEYDAIELVKFLLTEKLIASASIDQNNVSYKMNENELTKDVYSVITCQSKSLLFNDIIEAVELRIGVQVPISSTPIVAANRMFDYSIRTKTIPT
jgi:uncharacterized protein involved in tolerance to divalent cations